MNAERHEELWTRYLSRETLSPAEEAELVDALEKDEETRTQRVEEARIDGWLAGLMAAPREDEAFARRFEDLLAAQRDESRFIRKVRDSMAQESAPKGRRKPTRRKLLRRLRLSRGPGLAPMLIPALAAAGLILALLLLPGSPPPMNRDLARKKEPPKLPPPAPLHVRPADPVRGPSPAVPSIAPAERPGAPKLPRNSRPQPPKPAVTPAPPPASPPAPPPSTVAAKPAVAVLERVEGRVTLSHGGASRPARNGTTLLSGMSLHILDGPATVRFTDGTVLTIEPGSLIENLADRPGRPGGKALGLARGTVSAVVARQPVGRPLVFDLPHAVATVLGTTLTLAAEPERSHLEVLEGRVRFRRRADGRTIDVPGGFQATVENGVSFRRRPLEAPVFEDAFTRLPLDAWPSTWRRHRNSTAIRSGFQVVADRGRRNNRILACPGAPGGATQHAVLPLDAYPETVDFVFRLRLSGRRNTRAGIELEDGAVMPSVEIDAQAGVLRVDWPRGRALAEKPLRLPVDAWSLWKVGIGADGIQVDINGRTELRAKPPGFTRVTGASLISRGADTAEYDDVKVVRRLNRRR